MAEVIKKIVSEEAFDELTKQVFEAIKQRAMASHKHNAVDVNVDSTHRFVTDAQIGDWNKKVTTEQLNAAVNTFASGLAWKGVFDTLAILKEKIPAPKEGDFVIVIKEPSYNNKNTLLIYEGAPSNKWQTVGELFVPGKASQSQDGLMSKEDKKKLDGLNNYSHPSSHPATMITEDTSHRFTTDAEKAKWNKASTDATSALQKANINTQSITTVNGKIGEIENKFVYMTTTEAQQIITKYKG